MIPCPTKEGNYNSPVLRKGIIDSIFLYELLNPFMIFIVTHYQAISLHCAVVMELSYWIIKIHSNF